MNLRTSVVRAILASSTALLITALCALHPSPLGASSVTQLGTPDEQSTGNSATLASGGWTQLISGTGPSSLSAPGPRMLHTAIYDPDGDRMVAFGGLEYSVAFDEVWTTTMASNGVWQLQNVAPGRARVVTTSPSTTRRASACCLRRVGRVRQPCSATCGVLAPRPSWSQVFSGRRAAAAGSRTPACTTRSATGSSCSAAGTDPHSGSRRVGALPLGDADLDAAPPGSGAGRATATP